MDTEKSWNGLSERLEQTLQSAGSPKVSTSFATSARATCTPQAAGGAEMETEAPRCWYIWGRSRFDLCCIAKCAAIKMKKSTIKVRGGRSNELTFPLPRERVINILLLWNFYLSFWTHAQSYSPLWPRWKRERRCITSRPRSLLRVVVFA